MSAKTDVTGKYFLSDLSFEVIFSSEDELSKWEILCCTLWSAVMTKNWSELGQGYPCILPDTVIDLDCLKYTSIQNIHWIEYLKSQKNECFQNIFVLTTWAVLKVLKCWPLKIFSRQDDECAGTAGYWYLASASLLLLHILGRFITGGEYSKYQECPV